MKISLILITAIGAALALSSCTFQVNPDGSKSGSFDAASAIRAIEILNQK